MKQLRSIAWISKKQNRQVSSSKNRSFEKKERKKEKKERKKAVNHNRDQIHETLAKVSRRNQPNELVRLSISMETPRFVQRNDADLPPGIDKAVDSVLNASRDEEHAIFLRLFTSFLLDLLVLSTFVPFPPGLTGLRNWLDVYFIFSSEMV